MEKRITATEIIENLGRFTGTENIYRVPIGNFLYTDGVRYMAEQCNAYWLLTDSGIRCMAMIERSSLIRISITCGDNAATVEYTDGNGLMLHEHRYASTDFPLQALTLFFSGNTLLLPSEY